MMWSQVINFYQYIICVQKSLAEWWKTQNVSWLGLVRICGSFLLLPEGQRLKSSLAEYVRTFSKVLIYCSQIKMLKS